MNMERTSSRLPEDRLWQPVTAKWFVVVFGASLVYAVVRYHGSGEVAWTHFPLFILNKIISLAAIIFIACSYLIGRVIRWHNSNPKIKLVVIKFCGLMGFSLALAHAFFSVCLLTPAYFGKFFATDGRLNLVGELGHFSCNHWGNETLRLDEHGHCTDICGSPKYNFAFKRHVYTFTS